MSQYLWSLKKRLLKTEKGKKSNTRLVFDVFSVHLKSNLYFQIIQCTVNYIKLSACSVLIHESVQTCASCYCSHIFIVPVHYCFRGVLILKVDREKGKVLPEM